MADSVYNLAVEYGIDGQLPDDAPVGVAQLAHVHRVFNAIMGGGLGFAMEVIELDEFDRAVEGFRYFGLVEAADLLAELVSSYGRSDYDAAKEQAFDHLTHESGFVLNAYRRKASRNPADFGL